MSATESDAGPGSSDSEDAESTAGSPENTGAVDDWQNAFEDRDDDDWEFPADDPKRRMLSQKFIETVLLHEPWRSAIPRQGVNIQEAVFPQGLNLVNARVDHIVRLTHSEFLEQVNFDDSRFNALLSLSGSVFEKSVQMRRIHADTIYFLQQAQVKRELDLRVARVRRTVEMDSSTFGDTVILNSAHIEGSLFMRDNANFEQDINLVGAHIGGVLHMNKSVFAGRVEMDILKLGSNLIMSDGAVFHDSVRVRAAEIGGIVDLSGSRFNSLDFSGSRVAGELWLYSSQGSTRWQDGGELIMRNTHVGAIQDGIEDDDRGWPPRLQLAGFVYQGLGGSLGSAREVDMLGRDSDWYIDWLARDPEFSSQPYEQLASVFRAAGNPSRANDILYAGRERERKNSSGAFRLGLEILNLTMGYGIGKRYFRALWWVAGLVALGMLVLRISGEGRRNRMPYGLAFSLDHLLPVIHLRNYHFDISLGGWARYYFYFHKLMGYVLASFLIAGMAGLTQ